jgi:hypothetical protein
MVADTRPLGLCRATSFNIIHSPKCALTMLSQKWIVSKVGVDSRSLRSDSYVRMHHFVRRTTSIPFRRFWGDVRREFMQRLSAVLYGTLGSYLRDALQEGIADAVACLPVPRA